MESLYLALRLIYILKQQGEFLGNPLDFFSSVR